MRTMRPADQAQPDSEFCSTREAAERLGVSVKTAQLWVESGVLQAWKTPGGHRRIRRDSLESLLSQREQRTTAAVPIPRHTVLVVDDDAHMRELYKLNIGYWDLPIRLLTADNGFEGLMRVGAERPDLLITDLNMPGMDGFRMLSTLAGSSDFRRLRIVVVSALTSAEIREHGGLPQGIALFPKPVQFEALRKHVAALLIT